MLPRRFGTDLLRSLASCPHRYGCCTPVITAQITCTHHAMKGAQLLLHAIPLAVGACILVLAALASQAALQSSGWAMIADALPWGLSTPQHKALLPPDVRDWVRARLALTGEMWL